MNRSESIPKINRPDSLKDISYKAIKDSIINGALQCGEIYSENVLSKNMGISKTPIHEALLELSHKGFIEILPKKGFLIKDLSEKEIRDIYGFRLALEKEVVLQAIKKAKNEDYFFLESILSGVQDCDDLMRFMEEDIHFHRHLAQLTDNEQIIKALGRIWDLCLWVGFRALSTTYGSHGVLKEHFEILNSIKDKNVESAQAAIENHVNHSMNKVLESYIAD